MSESGAGSVWWTCTHRPWRTLAGTGRGGVGRAGLDGTVPGRETEGLLPAKFERYGTM